MFVCCGVGGGQHRKRPSFIRNYGKMLYVITLILINISTQLHTGNYISIVNRVIVHAEDVEWKSRFGDPRQWHTHITLTILRSQHGGTIGKANIEPIAQLLN